MQHAEHLKAAFASLAVSGDHGDDSRQQPKDRIRSEAEDHVHQSNRTSDAQYWRNEF
jgi:hypothetical protein